MKESITLRLDEELLEFLRKNAEVDYRSVNNFIEMILKKYKKEMEEKEKPGD